MLLCVDVGNTQIALGLYTGSTGSTGSTDRAHDADRSDGAEPADRRTAAAPDPRGVLVRDWRMRTDPRMTADELELALTGLLGPYAPRVTGIAALSTVPSLLRELKLLLERRAQPHLVVGPGVRTGVPLLVDNPREVGADRVMNTLAAHRLRGTACVVVDFGTSTNIDVVSARGEFLGGALAPGIEISMEALAGRAAALRTVELAVPRSVIGRNTVECLQSGMLYGSAGQVDGLVRRILRELGPGAAPVAVIGTGGLAPLLVGVSETVTEFVPDLTLLGLRLTYLRNARSVSVAGGGTSPPLDVRGRAAT